MPTREQKRESQFQLFGWVLFLVCSILFIIDSVATGNLLVLAGSVAFSLGCVVFLIPFAWKWG